MTQHTGNCLCGAVTITAKGAFKDADACHCAMCRRQNAGGAFYAAHFKEGVDISGGSLRWYAASEHGERGFCAICGSTLAWRLKAQPERVGVSMGLFDKAPGQISSRIFTDEAGEYTALQNDVPHKTGAQVITEFMAKMQSENEK